MTNKFSFKYGVYTSYLSYSKHLVFKGTERYSNVVYGLYLSILIFWIFKNIEWCIGKSYEVVYYLLFYHEVEVSAVMLEVLYNSFDLFFFVLKYFINMQIFLTWSLNFIELNFSFLYVVFGSIPLWFCVRK